MKTFFIRSILGVFFGAFLAILLTFLVIYIRGLEVLDAGIFIKNSLASIYCGWFFTVTPLFFENKRLSLPQQTLLHFGTISILYATLAFSSGWIPFNVISILLTFASFIIVYSIIWSAFYLYFLNEAKKLNADLNNL